MILTVTANPSLDRVVEAERVEPDRKIRCETRSIAPGGGGVNVARVLSRLGVPTRALWTRGGHTGARFASLLEREDVAHEALEIEGDTRESVIVLEHASGRHFRFVVAGPTLSDNEGDALVNRSASLDCAYVVASGSLPKGLPPDLYRSLGKRVRENGTRFILDTSGEALRLGAEAGPYLLKPNLRELKMLAGRDLDDEQQITDAARAMLERHDIEAIAVSLGAGGVLLVTRDETTKIETPTVTVRSKVGAGDSTVAGIVAAMWRGEQLADAVRFGVACGAAAVMTEGIELCRPETAERLARRLHAGEPT